MISQTSRVVRKIDIPFSGLSALNIIGNILCWESSGYYKESVIVNGLDRKKQHYSTERGSLNIKTVQSIIIIFDSRTNFFAVHLYFLGNYIAFRTKKQDESNELYELIHGVRFGFNLGEV